MSLVIGVVVLVSVVVIVGYLATVYNGLILVKNNIDKAWSNIDVLLKQRHDEIPKLVEICKGYMAHESGTLEAVIKARQEVRNAQGPAAVGQAEGALQSSMRQLFAL